MSTPSEAKREAERRLAEGKPQPSTLPHQLARGAIRINEPLFQHRNPLRSASEAHSKALAKAPERGDPLHPVLVWWDGNGWTCIDGHHRLAAYRKAKWRGPVLVQVFTGTVDAAMAKAAAANTPARLQMSRHERVEAGWRLVVLCPKLSKREQAASAGISRGQVGEMRRVREALLRATPERDLSDLSWHQARREEQGDGINAGDFDEDEAVKKYVQSLTKALGRVPVPRHLIGPLADAITEVCPAVVDALMEDHGYTRTDAEFDHLAAEADF